MNDPGHPAISADWTIMYSDRASCCRKWRQDVSVLIGTEQARILHVCDGLVEGDVQHGML